MARSALRRLAALGFLALLAPPGASAAATSSPSYGYCVEEADESTPPHVINQSEVRFAIEAAEIWFIENNIAGGTATVDVLVGPDGVVKLTRICRSSKNVYLDELSETIASMMRFEPVAKPEKADETWITVPIHIVPGHRDPVDDVSLRLPLPKL